MFLSCSMVRKIQYNFLENLGEGEKSGLYGKGVFFTLPTCDPIGDTKLEMEIKVRKCVRLLPNVIYFLKNLLNCNFALEPKNLPHAQNVFMPILEKRCVGPLTG